MEQHVEMFIRQGVLQSLPNNNQYGVIVDGQSGFKIAVHPESLIDVISIDTFCHFFLVQTELLTNNHGLISDFPFTAANVTIKRPTLQMIGSVKANRRPCGTRASFKSVKDSKGNELFYIINDYGELAFTNFFETNSSVFEKILLDDEPKSFQYIDNPQNSNTKMLLGKYLMRDPRYIWI